MSHEPLERGPCLNRKNLRSQAWGEGLAGKMLAAQADGSKIRPHNSQFRSLVSSEHLCGEGEDPGGSQMLARQLVRES